MISCKKRLLSLLLAVLQLEAAGVGGGGAGVARVVRELGEGGPVVAPKQQHTAGGSSRPCGFASNITVMPMCNV